MALSIRRPWSRNSMLVVYLFLALALKICVSQASPLELALTTEVDIDMEDTVASPSAQSVPLPHTHEVAVDPMGRYVFDPPFVEAAIGEFVKFHFGRGNHTVTESTFMSPCSSRGAFDTNFFNSAADRRDNNEVTLMIDSDNPRWFHCRQRIGASHCERGMVFAINPGRFWQPFLSRAENSTVAKASASRYVSNYANPVQWSYEHRTAKDADSDAKPRPTSTVESETAGGPMTMTVATTTSTLHPNSRWLTQTFTTTFRAEN